MPLTSKDHPRLSSFSRTLIVRLLGAAVVVGGLLTSNYAAAATVTVNTTAVNVANDGLCGLVEAVQAVNQASTYRNCTYTSNGQSDRIVFSVNGTHAAGNLSLDRNVEIVGRGQANTIIRSPAFCTVCSFGSPAGSNLTVGLSNLTVAKDTTSSFPVYGIWVNSSTPVTFFTSNVRVTGFDGNGIQLDGDSVSGLITSSTIESNATGIVSVGGFLQVNSSTIRNNTATGVYILQGGDPHYSYIANSTIQNNAGINGGGVYVEYNGSGDDSSLPVLEISGSTFSGNQASGDGGGLYAKAHTAIDTSVFDNNVAAGLGGGFAAVERDSGFLVSIETTTFKNNRAQRGAGVANYGPSDGQRVKISFRQSTFGPSNVATGDGGGIYSMSQIDTAENVTIHGNQAARGGGLFHDSGGESHLLHCTVTANRATQANGGGGLWLTTGNPIYFYNIIAENRAGSGSTPPLNNVVSSNPSLNAKYNLLDDVTGVSHLFPTSSSGGTNIVANPGLSALGYYGGWTDTRLLLASSPGLDVIPTSDGDPVGLDQRNWIRPIDGNLNGTASHDIGAVEMNTSATMYEAESLTVAAQSGEPLTIESHASYSGGQGRVKQANVNGFVTFQTGTIQPGTYGVIVWYKRAANAGRFRLAVGTSAGSTTPLGGEIDGYRSSPLWAKANMGTITVTAAGTRYLRFSTASKNASSSAHWMYVDAVQLYKTN